MYGVWSTPYTTVGTGSMGIDNQWSLSRVYQMLSWLLLPMGLLVYTLLFSHIMVRGAKVLYVCTSSATLRLLHTRCSVPIEGTLRNPSATKEKQPSYAKV